MTFRKGGILMTDAELESLFLEPLRSKYTTSKFFRTFVIAFQKGVLPELTLKEGDPCDPDYTKKYRDPYNNSVTWHYQKTFTLDVYRNGGGSFCDFRQGIICKAASKKCGCPEDSAMQEVSPGSAVKRCLVQENKVCALIDIDHGTDPRHTLLSNNLHELLFNPEKPLSCKVGTQCRFKGSNRHTPFCYRSGPFDNSYDIDFGSECAIGLFATPGSCEIKGSFAVGNMPGYRCYNFGPPRSLKSLTTEQENRVGFCAGDYGPYAMSFSSSEDGNLLKKYFPYMFPFIHPRSVPLRDSEMKSFVEKKLNSADGLVTKLHQKKGSFKGDACSVDKTNKMEDTWKYFASLDKDPPPGQDYVTGATKSELETRTQTAVDLLGTPGSMCKAYWDIDIFRYTVSPRESFKCVAEGTPDAEGNDGKCQEPGATDNKAMVEKFTTFLKDAANINRARRDEESKYDKDILSDNPEPPCLELN